MLFSYRTTKFLLREIKRNNWWELWISLDLQASLCRFRIPIWKLFHLRFGRLKQWILEDGFDLCKKGLGLFFQWLFWPELQVLLIPEIHFYQYHTLRIADRQLEESLILLSFLNFFILFIHAALTVLPVLSDFQYLPQCLMLFLWSILLFYTLWLQVLRVVGKFIFFIFFVNIVFWIKLELFPLFEHLKVFSSILDDVLWLISEDFPREIC